MHFVLFYDTVEDLVERRKPYREAHLAKAQKAHEQGKLIMAGALVPADGALLVFRANNVAEVEDFARKDPYVVNGLVKSWRVREWNVVVGGEN